MIKNIESALLVRLTKGLGDLVTEVGSYGQDLDSDLGLIVKRLPAVWVTFGGVVETKPYSVSKQSYKATGLFNVIVSVRAVNDTKRAGSVTEVGAYDLIYAVRRLLTNQDLDCCDPNLNISALQPGRVRLLKDSDGIAVYSCEFNTSWIEESLENNAYPAPIFQLEGDSNKLLSKKNRRDNVKFADPEDPDNMFAWSGQESGFRSSVTPKIGLRIHQSPDRPEDVSAIIQLGETNEVN